MENNVPSSFAKWDKRAKIGLVSICVLLIGLFVIISRTLPSAEKGNVSSGYVPNDAINTVLPKDKLEELEEMLAPLLRGNVTAFDSIDSANTGEIVASLLSHLCETKGIEEDETGAKTVLAEDVDALYSALFSSPSPKGNIQNGKVAKYDSKNGVWLFYGSEYFPEYEVEITATYTLGSTVYAELSAVKPAEMPSETPSEAPSETPSEFEESVSSEETESEDVSSDTVTSLPEEEVSGEDVSSEETSSEEISSEDVSSETEYVTVRSVVVTITVTDGKYTVTQMRDK